MGVGALSSELPLLDILLHARTILRIDRFLNARLKGRPLHEARTEMRTRITEILKPEQKQKYEEIVAESAGRAAGASTGRGRVFVLEAGGQPRMVSVRTGLSDGSMTEMVAGELKEGDQVIVGTAQSSGNAPAPSGPRLPF